MKRYYWVWLNAVILAALSAATIQSSFEEHRALRELRARLSSVGASIEETVASNFHARRFERIARTARRLQERDPHQRIESVAVCAYGENKAWLREKSLSYPTAAPVERYCTHPSTLAAQSKKESSWELQSGGQRWLIYARDLEESESAVPASAPTTLILVQDLSGIDSLWTAQFIRTFIISLVFGLLLITLMGAQARLWLQGQFRQLRQNVSAERLRTAAAPTTLQLLTHSIQDHRLIVIANREPYIHQRENDRIKVIRPASGLVSALEPILRQCSGLWIAHGSGSADREVSDAKSEIAVPPDRPRYRLRRVWLTQEEENGYYYGFANEGLWPLCHLAHTRPIFRLSDWNHYRAVNQKFTDAVPDDFLQDSSLILVQDYHFALLPRMLKQRVQKGHPRVGLFWHIPWPNPEAFGICPWNKELLQGMLGADVIGFHTQYHCNNFLETCNRYLEARIDWERFSVTMDNHETFVRAFPIGIDTPLVRVLFDSEREALKRRYGIHAPFIAVGVDRIDYTKGLIERIEAVERFLEKYPQYVGKFCLVQVGSPSRTSIPAYKQLSDQLEATIARVNERFGDKSESGYRPVIFIPQHHDWDEIQNFYQLGDLCMVTSLHDGMNLVAKEYVWCQQPDRGSLLLSKFTGASRELTEAFIVNPYSIEEMADAIAAAIALEPAERARRMLAMREKIQKRNAYQWAADLIQTLLADKNTASAAATSPLERPSASRYDSAV